MNEGAFYSSVGSHCHPSKEGLKIPKVLDVTKLLAQCRLHGVIVVPLGLDKDLREEV